MQSRRSFVAHRDAHPQRRSSFPTCLFLIASVSAFAVHPLGLAQHLSRQTSSNLIFRVQATTSHRSQHSYPFDEYGPAAIATERRLLRFSCQRILAFARPASPQERLENLRSEYVGPLLGMILVIF